MFGEVLVDQQRQRLRELAPVRDEDRAALVCTCSAEPTGPAWRGTRAHCGGPADVRSLADHRTRIAGKRGLKWRHQVFGVGLNAVHRVVRVEPEGQCLELNERVQTLREIISL